MEDPKRLSVRTCMVSAIAIILIIAFCSLTSCGSYQQVQIKKVNETNFVTSENDTITAKRRVLFYLQEDAIYKMNVKDGECVTVRSKLK